MARSDFQSVEIVTDLCRHANGYHILIMFLLVSGYSQAEVAQMLGISRQALHHETVVIRQMYFAGRKLSQRTARKEKNKAKTLQI